MNQNANQIDEVDSKERNEEVHHRIESTPISADTTIIQNNQMESDEFIKEDQPVLKKPSPFLIIPPLVIHILTFSMVLMPFQQIILLLVCERLNIPGSKAPHEQSNERNTTYLTYHLSSYSWHSHQNHLTSHFFHFHSPSILSERRDFWSTLPNYEVCADSKLVQKVTSWWSMIFALSSNIPALIATPLIGMLSDRYGRKFGLILPVLGGIIHIAFILLVSKFQLSFWLLVGGNLVQGFLGSFLVLEASAFAYLADTSPLNERSSTFGLIEACIFLAFMLGPYVGGQLTRLRNIGVLGVFVVCIILLCLVFLYILFILPESRNTFGNHQGETNENMLLDQEEPEPLSGEYNHLNRSNSFPFKQRFVETFKEAISIVSRRSIRSLALMFFSISIGFGGLQFVFYFASLKFGWDAFDMGKFMLVLALVRASCMAFLIPQITKHANKRYQGNIGNQEEIAVLSFENDDHDENSISDEMSQLLFSAAEAQKRKFAIGRVQFELFFVRFGMFIYLSGLFANAFVVNDTQFYLIGILEGIGAISIPLARGLISKSTSPEHQGKLFSAMALIQQSSGLISPLIFGMLYRWSVAVWPGALFIGIATFYSVGLGFTFFVFAEDLIDHNTS